MSICARSTPVSRLTVRQSRVNGCKRRLLRLESSSVLEVPPVLIVPGSAGHDIRQNTTSDQDGKIMSESYQHAVLRRIDPPPTSIAGIDLTGRRTIVTGGASGIGVETARALGECRCRGDVWPSANTAAGDETAEDIIATHRQTRQVRGRATRSPPTGRRSRRSSRRGTARCIS